MLVPKGFLKVASCVCNLFYHQFIRRCCCNDLVRLTIIHVKHESPPEPIHLLQETLSSEDLNTVRASMVATPENSDTDGDDAVASDPKDFMASKGESPFRIHFQIGSPQSCTDSGGCVEPQGL